MACIAELCPSGACLDLLDLAHGLHDLGGWDIPVLPLIDRLVAEGLLVETESYQDMRREVALSESGWEAIGSKGPELRPGMLDLTS